MVMKEKAGEEERAKAEMEAAPRLSDEEQEEDEVEADGGCASAMTVAAGRSYSFNSMDGCPGVPIAHLFTAHYREGIVLEARQCEAASGRQDKVSRRYSYIPTFTITHSHFFPIPHVPCACADRPRRLIDTGPM